ncbi:MAG TPA: hypothetical protein VK606_00605, partial [Verrucomicrobiae bacterium]|nr:hypothetical protein [Verrucomicrobiae bacterium]
WGIYALSDAARDSFVTPPYTGEVRTSRNREGSVGLTVALADASQPVTRECASALEEINRHSAIEKEVRLCVS